MSYLIKAQACLARQSVREGFDLSIFYDQATFFRGESSTQHKFMVRDFVTFDIQTYVYKCKALLSARIPASAQNNQIALKPQTNITLGSGPFRNESFFLQKSET